MVKLPDEVEINFEITRAVLVSTHPQAAEGIEFFIQHVAAVTSSVFIILVR